MGRIFETLLLVFWSSCLAARSRRIVHPTNTWVKRSPLPNTPISPRLGYEGACVWDSKHQLLIRYGGHNQGGGGEQGAEVWTFDLPHRAGGPSRSPTPRRRASAATPRIFSTPCAAAISASPASAATTAGNGGGSFT